MNFIEPSLKMNIVHVFCLSGWMVMGVDVASVVSRTNPEDVRKGETPLPAVKLPVGSVEDGKVFYEYNSTVTEDGMAADSDTVTGSEEEGSTDGNSTTATDATDDGGAETTESADGTAASPEGSTTDHTMKDATDETTVVESTDPKTDATSDEESATGTAASPEESTTETNPTEPNDATGETPTDGDLTEPTTDVPQESATSKDLITAPPTTDGVIIIPVETTNSSYYNPWLASFWSQLMSMGLFSG